MKPEMLSIGRFILCVMDVYMLYRFFGAIFQLRMKRNVGVVLFLWTAILIFFISAFGNTWLNLIVMPGICFLFSILTFDLSFAQGIAYTIIFYAIFAGGREVAYELLFRMVISCFFIKIPQWFAPGNFLFLLPEYVLSFLLLLLIERSVSKLEIRKNVGISWYLLIMPISSIIVLFGFAYTDFPSSFLLQIMICMGAFALYFCNAAIFIVLEKYTDVMNQLKQEEMRALKQEMENDNYQNMVRMNEQYRQLLHDVNAYMNHFRILALTEQQKKIVDIINEMEGNFLAEISDSFFVGNQVLNAIFVERAAKAKLENVAFTVFVEKNLDVDFISDADMIPIFGNLIDNALEAATKCEEGNRKVDVKMYMGNECILVFCIENTFRLSASRRGTKLLTTKKDSQRHGLGIDIVRKKAEHYGGTLALEERAGIFTATLMISAEQEEV